MNRDDVISKMYGKMRKKIKALRSIYSALLFEVVLLVKSEVAPEPTKPDTCCAQGRDLCRSFKFFSQVIYS